MFRLLRHFSIASALVLLAATVGLATVYRHVTVNQLIDHGESSNIALAGALANSIWPEFGTHVTSVSGLSGDELRAHPITALLYQTVLAQLRGLSVLKVKIYNSSGLTVFSTQASQIGADKSNNSGFLSARSGQVASELTHRDTFSAFENTIEDRDVISSYIPIHGPNGQIQGVLEIYDDVTPLLQKIDRAQLVVIVASIVVFAALYIALFLIVFRADRILNLRIGELDDARRHLHEANDELENRVAERTAELRKSEDRFKQFAAASSDWLWEQDENLRFTYLSHDVQSSSGLAAAAHIGKTRREVVHRGVTEDEWRRHQADLDARRPFRDFTFERVDEAGTIQHISVSGVPILDENNRFLGYRGTATNISERKQMEADLMSAKQQAEAASKAKSFFLANMSHELRTPLNAIIGYAELLQEEAEDRDDDTLTADLAKVRNAGRHLLGLVSNVLDLSKVEADKMDLNLEEIRLEELLAEMDDTARPLVTEKGNAFEVSNTATIPTFTTDTQKLRQALLNLLSNAAKFTKEGKVRLEVSQEPAERLNFVVNDTGIGMDADQLSRIFEPFTQADSEVATKYGGTGLGLTIAERITELLGGRLEVESEPDRGSRFTISLPIQQVDAVGVTALTA